MTAAVELRDVWEKYRIKFVREHEVTWEEIWALKGISLEVEKGECLGIIGENGAGKTTLLKIIAGSLIPDKGEIKVEGRVSCLMELGTGFYPELTGIENIFLNASMYRISKEEIEAKLQNIINFADIGKFIYAPVKYYSQGMYMRLAFALAIHVEPDILLIDDILAVGDVAAQRRCLKKIFGLKDQGKTIILVSHNMGILNQLCKRTLFLEKGRIILDGNSKDIIANYLEIVGSRRGWARLKKRNLGVIFNNGRVILDWGNKPITKEFGGYSSVFTSAADHWYLSTDAEWVVETKTQDEIKAKGVWPALSISQVWKIQITETGQVDWKISISDMNNPLIKEKQVGLVFSPEYDQWFSVKGEGKFPPFAFEDKWQQINVEGLTTIVGVKSPSKGLPSFIFEAEGTESIKILNTGYNMAARAIQYPIKEKGFLGKIIISEKEAPINNYLTQYRDQLLVSRTISQGPIRLYADLEKKTLRLYHQDTEITNLAGLHTSFLIQGSWYDTQTADWHLHRKGKELFINLLWKKLGLKQAWHLNFTDSGQLQWRLDTQTRHPLFLDIFKAGLLLKHTYQVWFCGHQQEEFPSHTLAWEDIPLQDSKARIFGLRKRKDLPAIVFDLNKDKNSSLAYIQNSPGQIDSRGLQAYLKEVRLGATRRLHLDLGLGVLEKEGAIKDYLRQKREEKARREREQKEQIIFSRTISQGPIRLYADLEKKTLRIYYQDTEITNLAGLHTSFLIKGSWYDTQTADWHLQKKGKELFINLLWKELGLKQAWHLNFTDSGQLQWKLDTQTRHPLFLDIFKAGLLLKHTYQVWFCGHQQEEFPSHTLAWEDIPLEDSKARIFGLRKRKDLPAIVFDLNKDKNNSLAYIQNSPGQINSRGLQAYLKEVRLGATRRLHLDLGLGVLEKEGAIKDYLRQKREEKARRETISKGPIRLYADLEEKTIRIYHQDREITSAGGLYLNLDTDKGRISSCGVPFSNVEKPSSSKMNIEIDYFSLPIVQTWQLALGDDCLEVTTHIIAKEGINLSQMGLVLECLDEYTLWKTSLEEGEFSLKDCIKDIFPTRLKYNKASQVCVSTEGEENPSLFLDFLNPRNILGLLKEIKGGKRITKINFFHFLPIEQQFLKANERVSLKLELHFNRKLFSKGEGLEEIWKVEKGDLQIVFNGGLAKVFFKGKEITSGLSIYNSLRCRGIWHDSSQGIWTLKERGDDFLRLEGIMFHLPLRQSWLVKLNKNIILWKVKVDAFENTELEIFQANTMLSNKYKSWIVGSKSGEFLDEYTPDYDILPFRFWYGPAEVGSLRTEGIGLPLLEFICSKDRKNFRAIVENSDNFYQARLLQYQIPLVNQVLQRGDSISFDGGIRIGH